MDVVREDMEMIGVTEVDGGRLSNMRTPKRNSRKKEKHCHKTRITCICLESG